MIVENLRNLFVAALDGLINLQIALMGAHGLVGDALSISESTRWQNRSSASVRNWLSSFQSDSLICTDMTTSS